MPHTRQRINAWNMNVKCCDTFIQLSLEDCYNCSAISDMHGSLMRSGWICKFPTKKKKSVSCVFERLNNEAEAIYGILFRNWSESGSLHTSALIGSAGKGRKENRKLLFLGKLYEIFSAEVFWWTKNQSNYCRSNESWIKWILNEQVN